MAMIRIADILGQEVTAFAVPAQQREMVWDTSEIVGGTYFIIVTIGEVSQTEEAVVRSPIAQCITGHGMSFHLH